MMMKPPQIARLNEEVATLRLENQRITQENKLLREKVDLLVRRIFGKSSEQMDSAQLMLMLQGEEAKKPEASCEAPGGLEAELEKGRQELKARPARRNDERKPRIPEHLPVGEEIIVDPEEVKVDPAAYRHIGEEVTEQIDFTPAKFSKRRIIRRSRAERDSQPKAAA